MVKVLFNRPVTLGENTFGKGVHDVEEKLCIGSFFDALQKDGFIEVLGKPEVEPEVELDGESKKDKKKAK